MEIKINTTTAQKDYELLDSGEGEKLERFGAYVLRRPDPQALWQKSSSVEGWQKADAYFERGEAKAKWVRVKDMPTYWNINIGGLTMEISLTPFKHTGLFPEQLSNWQWMTERISNYKLRITDKKTEINVLNLFGYTGGATLTCAKAGAKVTHVDASKAAITWARGNAELSGLKDTSIRWILDDALAFVKKEIKRGNKYDGIIMDPPAYGRGPDGEVWKIEESFLDLMKNSKNLLSDYPIFFLINGYASGYSALAYQNNITDLKEKFGGSLELGELTIEESASKKLLPAGIFARWQNN